MWGSKGRSGYGDSTLQGDYDDWQGLSRNGRQWKSEATHLTRSLSGHDYWHLRKQIRPTEEIPQDMYAVNDTVNLCHTLPNGKANLLAYADRPTPVKSKVSIKDKILPQFKRLQTLRTQMIDLEKAYRAGEMDIKEYSLLREVIVVKINRAEVLYRKAISVKAPSYDDDCDYPSEDTAQTWEETYKVSGVYASESCDHVQGESVSWIDELSDENCFKKVLQKACKAKRKLVQFSHQVKKFTQKAKAFHIRFEGV